MKAKLTFHRGRALGVQNGLQNSLQANLLRTALATRREYHDKSFGFRKPREYTFPDCELNLNFASLSSSSTDYSVMKTPKLNSRTVSRTVTCCGMSILCARMGIVRHISIPWISSIERKSQRFCLSGMG